jgi:hypothetical protein
VRVRVPPSAPIISMSYLVFSYFILVAVDVALLQDISMSYDQCRVVKCDKGATRRVSPDAGSPIRLPHPGSIGAHHLEGVWTSRPRLTMPR